MLLVLRTEVEYWYYCLYVVAMEPALFRGRNAFHIQPFISDCGADVREASFLDVVHPGDHIVDLGDGALIYRYVAVQSVPALF